MPEVHGLTPRNIARCRSLTDAITEVAEVRTEHDPLALHIFVARGDYRNMQDPKSGMRRETARRASAW